MAGVISLMQNNRLDNTALHVAVLDRQYEYLLRNITFDLVHDHLITRQVFDDVTMTDMKEEQKTSGKIRFLLDLLKKGDLTTYRIFKDALHRTRQEHIASRLVQTEKIVIQEQQLLAAKEKKLRADQTLHLGDPLEGRSQPQDIPRSPIAQPMPSFHGSPGMHDVHEKYEDGMP